MNYVVWSIDIMPYYTPTLLAKFKLRHAKRDQLCVGLATSVGGSWTPGALQFQGGPYAFDGTTVPCEGTFVFDFTDILPETADGSELYGLCVADSGDEGKLLGYKLMDVSQAFAEGGLLDPPVSFNYPGLIRSLQYPRTPDAAPVAVTSAQPASGRAPLTVKFDGSGSSGDLYGYMWDFGDGSSPVQVQPPSAVTHTYSTVGAYTATLTVLDEGWAEDSSQVTVSVTRKK